MNFAIKLGYKGKDKKARDKMQQLAGQVQDQAEFEKQKVKFKSYGLNAVLDQVSTELLRRVVLCMQLTTCELTPVQFGSNVVMFFFPSPLPLFFWQVEGIFKLMYIDPDLLQGADESSEDEDEESEIKHELKSFDCDDIMPVRRAGAAEEDEDGADRVTNRLRRQLTRQETMNDAFARKYAKQPVLNQRYEDVFRHKRELQEQEQQLGSGLDMSMSMSMSVGLDGVSTELGRGEDRGSVVEFDPNARREEVFSVVAPDDLLLRLGVDQEVRVRVRDDHSPPLHCSRCLLSLPALAACSCMLA